MATILDVIKGLNQAASNAYDGYESNDGYGSWCLPATTKLIGDIYGRN